MRGYVSAIWCPAQNAEDSGRPVLYPDDESDKASSCSLGYSFASSWKPHLMIQYVLGSGDKNPEDGIHGTFDGLFSGADTVLYGWMNLFFWQNLREFRVDLVLTPAETLTFRGEYHFFGFDEEKDAWYFPGKAVRKDPTGSSGRRLGHEVDLTLRKKISGWLEVLNSHVLLEERRDGESLAPLYDP
ncbi:MAG: alginate export family protein [Candidatus Aminicenantales bacterium]